MKVHANFERIKHKLLVSMFAFIAFFALGVQSVTSAETPQASPAGMQATPSVTDAKKHPEVKTTTTPVGTAASRIYADPVTGEIIEAPPAGVLPAEEPPAASDALSTSSEGLVETRGTTPAGGVMVDLKGRFQSVVTATKDADGKISTQCLSGVSGSGGEE